MNDQEILARLSALYMLKRAGGLFSGIPSASGGERTTPLPPPPSSAQQHRKSFIEQMESRMRQFKQQEANQELREALRQGKAASDGLHKCGGEPIDLPPVVPPVLNLNIGQPSAQKPAPQAPGVAGTGLNAKELAQSVYGPKGSGLSPYSSGIPQKPKNWRHPYDNRLRTDDAYKRFNARMHSYRELKSPGSTWGNPWTGPTSEELSGPNSLREYAKLHPQAMRNANLRNYPDLFLEKKRPRSYEQ